jgi:hypothetical protein
MNFLSLEIFLEFQITEEILFTLTDSLATAADGWGQGHISCHVGKTKSKSMTGQGDDVIHHRSSQIDYKFVNLGRIKRDGLVDQVRENKGIQTVPAPLLFHRRSITDGDSERQ